MKTTYRSLAFAGLLACVLAAPVAQSDGSPIGRSAAPAPLEGTWRVTISPYVCATGQPVPNVQFYSLLTFGRGGTLLEAASNVAFEPGQRSAGLGSWERVGPAAYHAIFEAWILFDSVQSSRYKRGRQRIDQGIDLVDADHWVSEATVTFFDVAGTVVPPTGCMRASATRLE